MVLPLTRRTVLLGAASTTMLAACALGNSPRHAPPIVFVHGNGDTAGVWMATLWRFESNGWPRERLVAIDIPYPLARDDDTLAQPGRSSTTDNMLFLAAEVDRVLGATGAPQVVLIANSRGGNTVRNYIAHGGGATKVSHAVLCGTPNHGVIADVHRGPNSEFNGAGPFLSGLNAPKGPAGDEVSPGLRWMTIRSDHNDKYAQPDGLWLRAKGMPTHVSYDGPALKGAQNVEIAGIDHRETAFSPKSFEAMYTFITGGPPVSHSILEEPRVVLDGKISGYFLISAQGSVPTNLPLVGATLEVYETDRASGARVGAAVHRTKVGADGRWGPFSANGHAPLEFVITAAGYSTTHIYRSPFARSSDIVNLRAERLLESEKDALAVVTLRRPCGYFGLPRDQITFDGKTPTGIDPGTPGVDELTLRLSGPPRRAVAAQFNGETVVGESWPVATDEISLLQLTY